MTMDLPKLVKPEKIRLVEINLHLTCHLCKGYFIDATTISECLHSFCRSCLIKFLQENSHCPICEVLINKAKPNIKLDKTLQDIVYKLVPELFLNEMQRRQRFYRKHPEAAAKATPEDRGEDTERTIFSPRDSISLSIEYIREDSTPGAITIPPPCGKNGTVEEKTGKNDAAFTISDLESAAIRRYLQCPGMCRVEVLKKFICSKYNVDVNKYCIEMLYKRVPLPDHYTLIDIAYIYSWKRNEPMKFFFKIIEIGSNQDIFPEDLETPQPEKIRKPSKSKRKLLDKVQNGDKLNLDISSDNNECDNEIFKKLSVPKTITNGTESSLKGGENLSENDKKSDVKSNGFDVDNLKHDEKSNKTPEKILNNKIIADNKEVIVKQLDAGKLKKEFTKITLNRNSNVEIITKVQQVSNKNGQPIGLKITKQLVKKPVIQNNKISEELVELKKKHLKKIPRVVEQFREIENPPLTITNKETVEEEKAKKNVAVIDSKTDDAISPLEIDPEKSKFLESFELTAKSSLSPQKHDNSKSNLKELDSPKMQTTSPFSTQKRKNSSPSKNDRSSKKPKLSAKASPKRKSESKNIQNPAVRQMMSNVHQSATNVSKIVEQSSPKSNCNKTDLQSLFDSCKINIPSSLSITIKEGTEDKNMPPVKPVKNYIEILKLPDAEQKEHLDEDEPKERPQNPATQSVAKNVSKTNEEDPDSQSKSSSESTTIKTVTTTTANSSTNGSVLSKVAVTPGKPTPLVSKTTTQSFQKMFEESLKKSAWSKPSIVREDENDKISSKEDVEEPVAITKSNEKKSQKVALDLTTDNISCANGLVNSSKKNILEIATQLYKKSKLEQNKNGNVHQEENKPKENSVQVGGGSSSRHIAAAPAPNYTPSSTVPLRLTQSFGLNFNMTQSHSPKTLQKLSCAPSPKRNEDVSRIAPIVIPPHSSSVNSKVKNHSPKVVTASQKSKSSSPSAPTIFSTTDGANNNNKVEVSKQLTIAVSTNGPSSSGGFCTVSSKEATGDEPFAKILRVSPKTNGSAGKNSQKVNTKSANSPKHSPKGNQSSSLSPGATVATSGSSGGGMTPHEILEKYNIQNLAQLTANFNFPINFGMLPHNQLAALHQAMILRHFELQNRQNWLNMNPSPLVQYEKYLQSLSQNQGQILSKEN